MYDNFENKPIQLITDEERIKDIENQKRLSEEFISSNYNPAAVAIFERIDPRFSQPIIAIVTYGLNIEETIGAIQVSNPYLGTYTERFYEGLQNSIRYYHRIKRTILKKPTTRLLWEGQMNKGGTS